MEPDNTLFTQNVATSGGETIEEALAEDDLRGKNLADLSEAVVTATDWTTDTIVQQLRKGRIDIDPNFQRRDAWTAKRKSRFVESLVLGLPVPQLVLAQRKDRGSYVVIDGKQRLMTLRQFSATSEDIGFQPLRLRDLEIRSDLNGKTLADMNGDPKHAEDVAFFQNQPIRTVVIKNWPNEEFLYLLFYRLNSLSLPLSPQELRQALHPGPFMDFVSDLSETSDVLQGVFKQEHPDFRMRDTELAIRFFAFRYFLPLYTGNLKEFLDQTCKTLNDEWVAKEGKLRTEARQLEYAILVTKAVFSDNAFRRYNGEKYENRFNRAVFDTMVFYFAEVPLGEAATSHRPQLRAAFERLCAEDLEFRRSLETTTKSIEATCRRLETWGKSLSNVLSTPIRLPYVDTSTNRIAFQ